MKDDDLDKWFDSLNPLHKKRVHSPYAQSLNKKRPKAPPLHINIPQPAHHKFYPQPPLLPSSQSSACRNNEVPYTYGDEHFPNSWGKQYDNFLYACETSDPTLSSLLTPLQLSSDKSIDMLEKAVLDVRKTLNVLDNVLVALRRKENKLGHK
jgi:hypothetical protein